MFFGPGDVTCHSYYDPNTRTNRHDILTCDEFVTPHTMVSTMPDYSDLPYYCKVMYYHRHELQAQRDIWFDVDKVLKNDASGESDPDSPLSDGVSEVQGIEKPESGKRTPYKIIHFEGWLDSLPNQELDRFCKVIFDFDTGHVLHMSMYEEDEWRDKSRYDREMVELQDFRAQKSAYDDVVMQMTEAENEAMAIRGSMASDAAALCPPSQMSRVPRPPADAARRRAWPP